MRTIATSLLAVMWMIFTVSYAASFSPASKCSTRSIATSIGVARPPNFATSSILRSGPKSGRITSNSSLLLLLSRDVNRKKNDGRTTSAPTNALLAVPGIGPEGCSLPSPSRVNTLPEPIQAIIVLAIFAALGLSSVAFSSFLDDITLKYEWVQSWRYTWPLLGVIYTAAGVTHFTLESEYINIYPQKGAWGFWYLPGSPKFHVQWTGIAEILGGLGLVIGGAYDAFMPVWGECPNVLTSAGIGSDAAAGLLLLTAAVTPANVYMYTHGAKLPMDGPDVPVVGHLIRGIMQVVLFGLLYQMGQGSFDALLSS